MKPYQHRVNRQEFLNCPGFYDGAYVRAYVEDTTKRGLQEYRDSGVHNFEPRIILEIADCMKACNLEFSIESPNQRENAFHKIDTLINALQDFRDGLAKESMLYKKRNRAFTAYNEAVAKAKADKVDGPNREEFFANYQLSIDPCE